MNLDDCLPRIGSLNVATAKVSVLVGELLTLIVCVGCGGGNSINSNGSRDGGGGGPVAASISGSIAVGTAPSAIAIDSTNDKIYVTDSGNAPTTQASGQGCTSSGADVRAIDGVTQQTTASAVFPLSAFSPSNPFATTLNPANHILYVLAHRSWSGYSGRGMCGAFFPSIDAFDTTSLALGAANRVGPGAGVDVNALTGNLYVAGWLGNQVAVMDFSSGRTLAQIPVGSSPVGVAVNATTDKIYIANSGSNDVSVIDGTSNSVVATITDPNAVVPFAVAANTTTNTIYVANLRSNNITVIDGSTQSITATIPVGNSPSGVAVDSRTNFIYVANAGNAQTGDAGNITVINASTNATRTLTDPSAKNPVAVAANPTTNKIYVANSGSNNITVINGGHN